MDIQHLFAQANPIPSHAIAAILAIALGAWLLWSKKGTRLHRMVGYVWVLLMLYVSISSFWIHTFKMFGLFSPIHLLSLLFIMGLYSGVRAARKHSIAEHQKIMKQLYFLGLVITGLFTFLPGRTMYELLFANL